MTYRADDISYSILFEQTFQTVEYRIRLGDLLNKGKIEHNIDIKPGDVLIIPEAFF